MLQVCSPDSERLRARRRASLATEEHGVKGLQRLKWRQRFALFGQAARLHDLAAHQQTWKSQDWSQFNIDWPNRVETSRPIEEVPLPRERQPLSCKVTLPYLPNLIIFCSAIRGRCPNVRRMQGNQVDRSVARCVGRDPKALVPWPIRADAPDRQRRRQSWPKPPGYGSAGGKPDLLRDQIR